MGIGARRATQPRYNVSLQVACSMGAESFEGTCRNLSFGGMYLESPKTLTRETELHIRFLLPPINETIEVNGKVRWQKTRGFLHGAGIQFFRPNRPRGLKPQHFWALKKFFTQASSPN